MALPREPRQKMINMMYLVLTALLALNVSSEILNAFKTINRSLENTNSTVNKSTETILLSLDEKTKDSLTSKKANIWLPKALEAQRHTKSIFAYIQDLKNRIIKESDGDPNDPNKKYKESNQDIATRIMVSQGEGKKLLAMLTEYKKNVLGIDKSIDSAFRDALPVNLEKPSGSTSKAAQKSWESAYFHMVPTVAALTILSKFQNDIKTSENKIVEFCHNKVGEVVVRYDTYAAFAQTDKSYVMPGDEMEVVAGVGAFSKAAKPIISIGGQTIELGNDGAAHKKMSASAAIGNHKIPVTIVYTDQEGNKQTITKDIEYTVGQSAASIALDKMNVLYIGVPNPVSISTTGAGSERISVTLTGAGGSIDQDRSRGAGAYIARVNSVTDEAWINVSVDGKLAGKSKFRVRTIPRPIAQVGIYESGANVPLNAFRAQVGVAAGVQNFPFELKYTVQSFTISADSDDGYIDDAQVQGNVWSPQARTLLNNLKPGRTVMIDEIYAIGEDGKRQKLPSLVYYIK